MRKFNGVLVMWCVISLFALVGFARGQDLMSVQVKEAPLRSAPSFLGKIVAKVLYAKQVEVLEEQGVWNRVSVPDSRTEGWIHTSALTKKKIILTAGANDVQKVASSDEVALAGKGFNADVVAPREIAFGKWGASFIY